MDGDSCCRRGCVGALNAKRNALWPSCRNRRGPAPLYCREVLLQVDDLRRNPRCLTAQFRKSDKMERGRSVGEFKTHLLVHRCCRDLAQNRTLWASLHGYSRSANHGGLAQMLVEGRLYNVDGVLVRVDFRSLWSHPRTRWYLSSVAKGRSASNVSYATRNTNSCGERHEM